MTIGIFVLLMGIIGIIGLVMSFGCCGDLLSTFGMMMFSYAVIACLVISAVSAVEINKNLDVEINKNLDVNITMCICIPESSEND